MERMHTRNARIFIKHHSLKKNKIKPFFLCTSAKSECESAALIHPIYQLLSKHHKSEFSVAARAWKKLPAECNKILRRFGIVVETRGSSFLKFVSNICHFLAELAALILCFN